MKIDVSGIKTRIEPYLEPHMESLRNFQFSIANPLFWAYLFILFLILLKFWGIKKSFSFCAVTAIILAATTRIENFVLGLFAQAREPFDPIIIRALSAGIIFVILIYYIFLKTEA
jgi:hypothetical protein